MLDFPATFRNRAVILEQLRARLPARGRLLEVASGSGQHAAALAPELPGWSWQPSDPDPRCLASIQAWTADLPQVRPPLLLDVRDPWPEGPFQAVLAINLIHIAPWEVTGALMKGAARVLAPGGLLYLYGALMLEGRHTAPSNQEFDRSLRAQDPSWGVRSFEAVCQEAEGAGLTFLERVAMPSNNFSLWFQAPADLVNLKPG